MQKEADRRVSQYLPDLGSDLLFSACLYGAVNEEALVAVPLGLTPALAPAPSQNVPEVSLLSLEKRPGRYNFSLNCKRPTFSSELNTLFVQSQTSFAVEFGAGDALTPSNSMSIRAMVCYADPGDLAKLGPIHPCSCNAHVKTRKSEYGTHFIISAQKNAKFSDIQGHTALSFRLQDLQGANAKYTAVYSYASYTSCLAKGTKVATVFSLMDGEVEEGRDYFFVNVCACPPRDMTKAVRKSQCPNQPRRKRRTSSADELLLHDPVTSPVSLETPRPDCESSPDEDGCYVFQWRLRDREMYRHLCGLKRRYQELEQQIQSHSPSL